MSYSERETHIYVSQNAVLGGNIRFLSGCGCLFSCCLHPITQKGWHRELSTSANAFFCTCPLDQGEAGRDGGLTLHNTHFSLFQPDCKKGYSFLSFTALTSPRHRGFLHIPPFSDLVCTPTPVPGSDPKAGFWGLGVLVWRVLVRLSLGLIPACQETRGEASTPACACSPHPPRAWQVSQVLPRWSHS